MTENCNGCVHYSYMDDRNGSVAIEHCSHALNPNTDEGNCTDELCPVKEKEE